MLSHYINHGTQVDRAATARANTWYLRLHTLLSTLEGDAVLGSDAWVGSGVNEGKVTADEHVAKQTSP